MDRQSIIGLLKDWGLAALITVGVLVILRLAGVDLSGGGTVPVASAAPPLGVPQLDGSSYDLAAEPAEVVVVNFWATWCGPCRDEIPEFTEFAAQHDDVAVLGVSVDENLTPGQLGAASKRLGIGYRVLHDRRHEAANRWGVNGYPTTFVLDRDRKVVDVYRGTMSRKELEAAVAAARR